MFHGIADRLFSNAKQGSRDVTVIYEDRFLAQILARNFPGGGIGELSQRVEQSRAFHLGTTKLL